MTASANGRGGGSRGPAGANDPVLLSKVTVPSLPEWAVTRPRIERLIAEGARGPLTTVTGPPGAGKSMAIAAWAAASTVPGTLVWITLDDYDNPPRVFWSYVVTALRRAGLAVPRILPASAGRDAVNHEFILRLTSILAGQDPPVLMVLDDLHLLTEPATLEELAYLLRNASQGLHLVVSSRIDPLLPLHRYRLTGELAEIRAEDLAFTVPEASLLMTHHGITLSATALECLAGRTEGWAAGMRLAATSLADHPDPEQFVKELDAEESAVTSYLVEEVLNAQPPHVRELLLRTSILDRISMDLAAELAGDPEAAPAFPELARQNAFIQPLGHGWYRYHSLFAAVLRLKLRSECPDQLAGLHRQAAQWFHHSGWLTEAVRHAAESGDWPFAAGIVLDELAIGQLIEPRGNQSLADEFRRMPPDLTWAEPQPLLALAALELSGADGQPRGLALAAAERILAGLPATDEIPARLAAALIRLTLSRRTGDLAAAAAAAAAAEAWLGELPAGLLTQYPGIRAQVLSGRGAVELWAGRLDEAAATFRAGATAAASPDNGDERSECLGYLALLEALHGRLGHAIELASAAAEETGSSNNDGLAAYLTPAASVALASVHLERNELQRSHGQLKLAVAALRISPDKLVSALACLIAARRRLVEGRAGAAVESVARARQGWSPPDWLDHRLALIESRARAAAGETQAAVDLAERAGATAASDAAVALGYARIAAGDLEAAKRVLAAVTEDPGPVPERVRLEAWLLDARASYGTGDGARGRRSLENALRLGKPEQFRLPFATERAWLRPVLRREPDLAQCYRQLLEPSLVSPALAQPGRAVAGQATPLIVERLSAREHEVLSHLSEMHSTAEIASEMYISVNTVKTHLRSIYRKLSAAHRGEAVRRARQLHLIGSIDTSVSASPRG